MQSIQVNPLNTIEATINLCKEGADESLMEVLNLLHEQLHHASNAAWTKEELESELFTDNDVLDLGVVEDDSAMWSTIRDIQLSIVHSFGK